MEKYNKYNEYYSKPLIIYPKTNYDFSFKQLAIVIFHHKKTTKTPLLSNIVLKILMSEEM